MWQADLDAGRRSDGLTTEEREILAKAAAWFARETNSVSGVRAGARLRPQPLMELAPLWRCALPSRQRKRFRVGGPDDYVQSLSGDAEHALTSASPRAVILTFLIPALLFQAWTLSIHPSLIKCHNPTWTCSGGKSEYSLRYH